MWIVSSLSASFLLSTGLIVCRRHVALHKRQVVYIIHIYHTVSPALDG
jgi:hypothetical protein